MVIIEVKYLKLRNWLFPTDCKGILDSAALGSMCTLVLAVKTCSEQHYQCKRLISPHNACLFCCNQFQGSHSSLAFAAPSISDARLPPTKSLSQRPLYFTVALQPQHFNKNEVLVSCLSLLHLPTFLSFILCCATGNIGAGGPPWQYRRS